jgi:hypothetical protein
VEAAVHIGQIPLREPAQNESLPGIPCGSGPSLECSDDTPPAIPFSPLSPCNNLTGCEFHLWCVEVPT